MPPSWGRPPGGATGVGRFYEGVADDVYRFQELDSDDEKNGVSLDQRLNPDELYFNDMDIQAWERRASALGYSPDFGFQEEDEGYFDDAGEAVTAAEYEELLFQRVLEKIRAARATGNPDVQLSSEEIEAYQSKLHGGRAPAARPQPKPRQTSNPKQHDTASVISESSTHREPAVKTKKKRSIFSSKPKKEKPSSRKRAPSNVSSANSPTAPGFIVPGADGQAVYTPINPYQGDMSRDPHPYRHPSHPNPDGYHAATEAARGYGSRQVSREAPGGFPGAFPGAYPGYFSPYYGYTPEMSPQYPYGMPAAYPQQQQQQQPQQPEDHPQSASEEPVKLIPFPIEPYQYHSFEASDSSSPQATSPQASYVRNPSAPTSEASYTTIPRRVPVPLSRTVSATSPTQSNTVLTPPAVSAALAEAQAPVVVEVVPQPVPVPAATTSGSGKEGERRRKGKKKKV